MSTATIINNIQKLPLAEQRFVVEQVSKLIHDTERKQASFAEIPEGYMSLEEFRVEAKASLTKILNERGIH